MSFVHCFVHVSIRYFLVRHGSLFHLEHLIADYGACVLIIVEGLQWPIFLYFFFSMPLVENCVVGNPTTPFFFYRSYKQDKCVTFCIRRCHDKRRINSKELLHSIFLADSIVWWIVLILFRGIFNASLVSTSIFSTAYYPLMTMVHLSSWSASLLTLLLKLWCNSPFYRLYIKHPVSWMYDLQCDFSGVFFLLYLFSACLSRPKVQFLFSPYVVILDII